MKKTVLFLLLASHPVWSLSGYQFEDNQSDKRYVQENGEMTYALPTIPSYIAACFNLYINHNRYSSLVPIMDFRTTYQKEYMEFLYGSKYLQRIRVLY